MIIYTHVNTMFSLRFGRCGRPLAAGYEPNTCLNTTFHAFAEITRKLYEWLTHVVFFAEGLLYVECNDAGANLEVVSGISEKAARKTATSGDIAPICYDKVRACVMVRLGYLFIVCEFFYTEHVRPTSQ